MLAQKLLSSLSGAEEPLYVDDVFSAYTYTGNGSTQTINNGIDLAGKGGMVWKKARNGTWGTTYHHIVDTVRGPDNILSTNVTESASATSQSITAFSSSGFYLGASGAFNGTGSDYISWTFRKAPKFFDVVTYTGNNSLNRAISHGLGIEPGMMIIKATNSATMWVVYHRGLSVPANERLILNTTNPTEVYAGMWGSAPNATQFGVSEYSGVNTTGITYVAYLFAHDSSADGIIQCGTYTGTAPISVTLGWEPQFLLVKESTGFGGWEIMDSSRGFPASSNQQVLETNTSGAEFSGTYAQPTATGFKSTTTATFIYMAIRRPNKPPTTGTQVYNAIARTGTGAAATVTGVGFAPDLSYIKRRTVGSAGFWEDRLRGATIYLMSSTTNGDAIEAQAVTSFGMDGVSVGTSNNVNATDTFINHFFKRAVGVFDEVCYTGTGAARTVAHNLGVAPELWIIKDRDTAVDWGVGCTGLAATEYLALNATDQKQTGATYWNSTYPSASVFSLGTGARINTSTKKYVAYLFATLAGISKVGSYTGNGTSQTINCGFTTGARFILIKRTDSTGDWYVWDTVRGIIAGNDPHLSLNTNVAEVTSDDSIDPAISGFIVNQLAATNINVTGGTFIFLAFA